MTIHFLAFNISFVPRIQNASADLLANVASKLIPSQEFSPHRFSIEFIFRPSVPENITILRVFNKDSDIINFLTSEGSYDNKILDENENDTHIKEEQDENPIPNSVVKLEDLYDLKDRFKRVTNLKLKVQP